MRWPLRRRSRPAALMSRPAWQATTPPNGDSVLPHTDAFHASVRGRAHCHRYACTCGCDSAARSLRIRPNGPGALVALYNATDGENWPLNEKWLSDAPLGEWYGVTTLDDGRVTGLNLGTNGLSGEIPPELGSLSNLTYLYLDTNDLSGEIPAELGSLSNLTYLDLVVNDLSGEIPAELGSLSNLTYLGLDLNALSGEIPAELGSLSNLTYLGLDLNALSGEIPAELGSLSNLGQLVLYGNNALSGEIPPELGSLSPT